MNVKECKTLYKILLLSLSHSLFSFICFSFNVFFYSEPMLLKCYGFRTNVICFVILKGCRGQREEETFVMWPIIVSVCVCVCGERATAATITSIYSNWTDEYWMRDDGIAPSPRVNSYNFLWHSQKYTPKYHVPFLLFYIFCSEPRNACYNPELMIA